PNAASATAPRHPPEGLRREHWRSGTGGGWGGSADLQPRWKRHGRPLDRGARGEVRKGVAGTQTVAARSHHTPGRDHARTHRGEGVSTRATQPAATTAGRSKSGSVGAAS